MELQYKRADAADLDLLTETRIEVLRAANKLDEAADVRTVRALTREYYLRALGNGSHIAYLVLDGGSFVGAGGVSFFEVMPTCHNPTGRKAYIMNIYTRPAYRRRGIALHTLDLLVCAAHENGICDISLEATADGRPLYEKYGFVPLQSEMGLPL